MNHPAMRAAHFTTSDTVIPRILRCGWGSSARSQRVRRLRIVDGSGIALSQHDVGLQDLLMNLNSMPPNSSLDGTSTKHHFPMQNRLKITPSRSSAVTAPVMRPRA